MNTYTTSEIAHRIGIHANAEQNAKSMLSYLDQMKKQFQINTPF